MNMKKLFSLIMALLMAFSMVAVAEEVEEPEVEQQNVVVQPRSVGYTVTIADETDGRKYEAYQIFKGSLTTVDNKPVLGQISWGDGVEPEGENGLLAALCTAFNTDDNVIFSVNMTATQVADKLSQVDVEKLAKVIAQHCTTAKTESCAKPDGTGYTMSELDPGYYLVKEVTVDADVYSAYILEVVEDVTVTPKREKPTVDKKIDEDKDDSTENKDDQSGKVDSNNAAIGDTVYFEVTSKVPDMTGYDRYFFVINDTMSEGLTFNNNVAITVGEKILVKDTDFTVVENPTGQIEIVLKNFIQYKGQKDVAIVITYTATVNENAKVDGTAETNTVKLTYSNDPRVDQTPDTDNPDKPGPNTPVGKTPEETTRTYVTKVVIEKEDMNGVNLAGATFRITGTRLNTVIVEKDVYTVDEAGTYYLLKNGTYTTEVPTKGTADQYASTEVTYSKSVNKETITKPENVNYDVTVGSDGVLNLSGLSAGKYTITEITAPEGYKLLVGNIELTISWSETTTDSGGYVANWTYSATGTQNMWTLNGNVLTIKNELGSSLPETGGVGTTYIYIGGVVLLMAAAVMLISKRRATVE